MKLRELVDERRNFTNITKNNYFIDYYLCTPPYLIK